MIVWAAWLVLKYFQWTMTYFVVTSRRVIYRTGVLSKRGVEIPLERVNNINFHQRIIDRIIGAGDLDIESAGKDGQSHFDFIRHPDGVQHEIYRQMEFRNMPQMQPSGVAAPAPTRCRERARADRAARAPPRPGSHHGGRVRAEEGAAPRADVARASASGPRPVDGGGEEPGGNETRLCAVAVDRPREHVVGVGCGARARRRTRRSRHR